RGHGVKVAEEAIDRAGRLDVVRQLLAEQALREVDRVLPHVLAKLGHDLLALSQKLLLTRGNDSGALVVGLGGGLGDDLLALDAGLVAYLRGFGAGLGELAVVLLEGGLGLGLRGLGTLDAALNPVLPLGQDLLELRKHELPEENQDDNERDNGPDDVIGLGHERVDLTVERQFLRYVKNE